MSSYFTKFLRAANQAPPRVEVDHLEEFVKSWESVKDTLEHPDERQLARGIGSTNVPEKLKLMVDALVAESARAEMGETGDCMEFLLKNDVLGTLVRLSETDRPRGVQAEVLRAIQNMIVMLDEQFLVHSAVHKAVLRLLRTCVGDDIQEQLDGKNRPMGAAGSSTRAPVSEHEEDLVNLLCILCSRILTYRELLMIFFHDKHWYRSEPLFSVEEEDEDEEEDEEEEARGTPSPTPSQRTVTGVEASTDPPLKKPEYEFLLFNYLLRFVHREGQIGEFARAGLRFLMDVAMSPADMTPSYDQSGGDPINDAALALAEYILDGDFSDVLGAGLVAVYSTLPRKLGFTPDVPEGRDANATMVIGNSGLESEDVKEQVLALKDRNRALGIEDAGSPDFKGHLDHFLKLLEFLQDVLRKNVETDGTDASHLVGTQIVQSILDAVRRVFLEDAFYASILECSDTDGTSVAVMSYIDIMVRTLRPGPLLDLLVEFLTEEDNDGNKQPARNSQTVALGSHPPLSKAQADKSAKLRRRKSSAMVLLEMEAPDSRKKSEYVTSTSRFTLRDLLLANLKSKNQASGTTALQLLSTMLTYQPNIAAEKLLVVIHDTHATAFPHPVLINGPQRLQPSSSDDSDDDEFRYPGSASPPRVPPKLLEPTFLQPVVTYSTHEREMGLYLALISRVDPSTPSDAFSTGYDHYLHDALLAIQSQPSYWTSSEVPFNSNEVEKYKHRLNANDPILSRLLESARAFFSNTPDFNVGMTGVFATLALNPNRSLAGWLTFAHNENLFSATPTGLEEDIADDKSIDFRIDEKLANDANVLPAARMDEHSRPVVHTVFQSLVNQLERYRQQVDDFDKYLSERRQGLLFSENLTDALQISLEETTTPPKAAPVTPTKSKTRPSAASALSSLWTPKKSRTKPTEPATPQRSQKAIPPPSPFGTHYHQTASITIEPVIAPVPFTSLWTPSKKQSWDTVEEDVFGSGWSDRSMNSSFDEEEEVEEEVFRPQTVTLSQLLDNVVILEESIKELVAIIHARRSLGIDALRYV
ncbi:hypothetical protein D9611_004683 [Ephemerocybe angulata]|uniref:Retinoic acid induced 16-like protein-domain-containing protein n=1 Tax=Ephemerocybe angulata TaxID=980116 RepID=A0A8H5EXA4_9AGAR|nr:hypothetical protein D9611_004683 [Tulosesus angulatus]